MAEAAACRLVVEIDGSLAQHTLAGEEKRNVYLVIKEAINNAIKYAQCDAITLRAHMEEKELVISIADNGRGFDTVDAAAPGKKQGGGNGLKNMQIRCAEIKWKLTIQSEKGKGSTVTMRTKIKN